MMMSWTDRTVNGRMKKVGLDFQEDERDQHPSQNDDDLTYCKWEEQNVQDRKIPDHHLQTGQMYQIYTHVYINSAMPELRYVQ
jgi:hypothetical protein